jgi:hypothetical protein
MADICSVCNKPITEYDCRSVVTVTTIRSMHKACDTKEYESESEPLEKASEFDVYKLLTDAVHRTKALLKALKAEDAELMASTECENEFTKDYQALEVLMYCAAQEVLNGSPDAQDYEERFGKPYDASAYERLAKRDM